MKQPIRSKWHREQYNLYQIGLEMYVGGIGMYVEECLRNCDDTECVRSSNSNRLWVVSCETSDTSEETKEDFRSHKG